MSHIAQIIEAEGEDVEWLKREEQDVDPDTGDIAVGTVFEPSRTIKAIVSRGSIAETIADPGYSTDDFIRLHTASQLQHKDRIVYQGSTFEVGPPDTIRFRGAIVLVQVLCKKMIA